MDNRNRFWESGPSAILSKADKWKQKNWGEEDGLYHLVTNQRYLQ